MVKKATRISRFVTVVEGQPVVVGLDVHKKTYSVALFSKEDGLVESYTCPSGEAALAHQLTELGLNIEHIVYESGPTGFALSRVLADAGFNVSVIAASRIPRGYAAAAKNDRLDAERLATYYARGLLRPIAVPTVEQEGYRALVRRRKRIAESRGKIKQKIKGFLLASGIDEPRSIQKWSLAASADLTALEVPPQHHMALASMVREYLFLLSEDKILRSEIRIATKRMHPEPFERLTSIVGVGETAASNFVAELFSPERFNDQRKSRPTSDWLQWSARAAQVPPKQGSGSWSETSARHLGRSRMAMDVARSRGQGALQSTFCEAWGRAEGHCGRRPQARNQALAVGGGPTPAINGGCCERGLVGITDSKKGQHPYQPARTENGTW